MKCIQHNTNENMNLFLAVLRWTQLQMSWTYQNLSCHQNHIATYRPVLLRSFLKTPKYARIRLLPIFFLIQTNNLDTIGGLGWQCHMISAFLLFNANYDVSHDDVAYPEWGKNDKCYLMDGWFLTIVKLPKYYFVPFKLCLLWTFSLKLKLTAVFTRRFVCGRDGCLFDLRREKKLVKLGIYPDAKGEHGFFGFDLEFLHASLKASHSAKKKLNLTSGKDVNPGGTHYSTELLSKPVFDVHAGHLLQLSICSVV